MGAIDPEWARLCLFYGDPSPRGQFLAWIVEFSSDSNEDGWTYADMMLKKAAQRAGTDLGYSLNQLDIQFSQDGWTTTTLPDGNVLVCQTTQVSSKPWHRVVRKPTEEEQERWAAPETPQPHSGPVDDPFADLLTEDDETTESVQARDRDVDALLIQGTAAVVGNLLNDLGVLGEGPEITEDNRIVLTEIQARSLYFAAFRSLPKCIGPGEFDEDEAGDLVRVDPEDCAMPSATCHTCAAEGRSLPDWHPARGGSGLY